VADQAERVNMEALFDKELEDELRAGGIEPEEADRVLQELLAKTTQRKVLPGANGAGLRVVEGGNGGGKALASASRSWVRAKVSAWVAATAAAAGLMVRLFAPLGGTGKPTPHESVAELRAEANEACNRKAWEVRKQKLDEAWAKDPEGEKDPRIVEERRAIAVHSPDGMPGPSHS
jgi:hypothetical protein